MSSPMIFLQTAECNPGYKAAEYFGIIRAALEKQGKVIGVYDMEIAAQALRHGLTVVTNNTDEFARVNNLKLANWL
jgi:tRNA(fMet)-specific endonuclease VapC